MHTLFGKSKMSLWRSAINATLTKIRDFVASLLEGAGPSLGQTSQSDIDRTDLQQSPGGKSESADSLLSRIRDGLSGHSEELATFARDIDPATGTPLSSGPFAKMQKANQNLDVLVEEAVGRLVESCGKQFAAECSQIEAYQGRTNAFDKQLSEIQENPLMTQVVTELLGMVQKLRDENESVRKEVANARRELSLLAARANAAEREARVDTLTKLLNRRAFDELHANCHETSQDHAYCLLMLDADRFKSINDRFGHPAGDAVLALIGKIIRENCRTSDQSSRWGGEEFAVLMPECNEEMALVVAERLRKKIETTVLHFGEHHIKFTVSCGIVQSSPEKSRGQILQEVDRALYAAKEQGRNKIVVYSESIQPEHDDRGVETEAIAL